MREIIELIRKHQKMSHSVMRIALFLSLVSAHVLSFTVCQTPSKRRMDGRTDKETGSTNKYTKFDQLIIRKIIKIIATRCHILRLKCTKFYFRCLPVCPFVFDTVNKSQRRRHGVMAAIVVDVVGALRPCVSLSVRLSTSLMGI